MHLQWLLLLLVACNSGKKYWDWTLPRIRAQIELSSAFVYDYKMSTSGSSARNSHLTQGERIDSFRQLRPLFQARAKGKLQKTSLEHEESKRTWCLSRPIISSRHFGMRHHLPRTWHRQGGSLKEICQLVALQRASKGFQLPFHSRWYRGSRRKCAGIPLRRKTWGETRRHALPTLLWETGDQ